MDLPTYTNIWRIEKRLYKLYDFRLPAPLPITWIAVFAGITIPYIFFLVVIGLPFNHNLVWLYVLPPGVLTWLTTRPVIENKRLPELVGSQLRYLSEPRTWCRMAPFAEKDNVVVSVRVWHRHPPGARPRKPSKAASRAGSAGPALERAALERAAAAQTAAAAQAGAPQVTEPTVSRPLASASRPQPARSPTRTSAAPLPVPQRATAQPEAAQPEAERVKARRAWQREPQPERTPTPDGEPGPVVVRRRGGPRRPIVARRPSWAVPPSERRQQSRALEVSHNPEPDPRDLGDPGPAPFAQPSWPETSAAVFSQAAASPEVGPFPEVGAFPELVPFPEDEAFPEDEPCPEDRALPEPEPEAAPAAESAPAPECARVAESAPVAEAALATEAAPVSQTRPVSEAHVVSEPEIAALPEVAPAPEPGTMLELEPLPDPDPAPVARPRLWSRQRRASDPASPSPARASGAPTSGGPASEAPASGAPTSGGPASEAPASGAPVSDESASAAPASSGRSMAARVAALFVDLDGDRTVPTVERALSGPGSPDDASWRRRVKVVTGGQGPGQRDREALDRDRARMPLPGPRRIAVLGCTGGAGQSVIALMTGHALAAARSIPVAVLDLNPGDGSLAARIEPVMSVTALLAGQAPDRRRARGRLDVIAAGTRALGPEDYRRLASLLAEKYPLTMIDPAPSGLTRILPLADQLVLVTPASPEAASALAHTQQWLSAHGYDELAARAVTVVNGVSRQSMQGVLQAESVARGRCRAIVRVPWDDQVPAGAESPAALHPQTRLACTALAGVLVAGLGGGTAGLRAPVRGGSPGEHAD